MSFADYLRDRISNDYKNLMIQKLEEIRHQTEELKNEVTPSLDESRQSLRQAIQSELSRVQDSLERQLNESHQKVSSSLQSMMDAHISSWYEADISPFGQQLDVLLSDIVSNVPTPPIKKNPDIASLADLMKKLDEQNTQSEILNTLLMHIASWVGRAILFVVKADQASGWAALGLGGDWNTDRVRSTRVDLKKQNILSEVVSSREMTSGPADKYPDNGEIYMAIGNKFPVAVASCPIIVRGKIAGILYADFEQGFEQKPDLPNLLFLATRAAGLAIDMLPLKPRSAPSPAVVKETTTQAAAIPPPVPQMEPPPHNPPPIASVEPALPPAAIPPDITAPVSSLGEEIEVAEEPAEEEEEFEETEGTVIMPAIVPPPVVSEEEQKLHDDAKRFARLLVSEIKLYNEAQVAAGREHRDLYDRLREDIERSRRMYQDRVPGHIHSSTNYFYEELVRTLANGDPQLLGM